MQCGAVVWSLPASVDYAVVRASAAGDVYVASGMGTETLSRLDGNGVTIWSKTFQLRAPSEMDEVPLPFMDVAPDGTVTLATAVIDPVDVGVPLTPVARDLLVASYAPDGSLKWAKSFGAVGADVLPDALAVDAAGRVLVAGGDRGINSPGVDLGAGPVTGNFMLALEADGSFAWTQPATGGHLAEWLTGLAVDPAGGFVGTGSISLMGCDTRLFVARYDDDGAQLSSKSFSSFSYGNSIALDSQAAIYVTVNDWGGLDLGGGARAPGALLAKLDSQYGLVWERQLGDDINTPPLGLAVDLHDNVYAYGEVWGNLFVGGERYYGYPLVGVNMMAKYAPDGTVIWADGSQAQTAFSAVAMENGDLVVATTGALERLTP